MAPHRNGWYLTVLDIQHKNFPSIFYFSEEKVLTARQWCRNRVVKGAVRIGTCPRDEG